MKLDGPVDNNIDLIFSSKKAEQMTASKKDSLPNVGTIGIVKGSTLINKNTTPNRISINETVAVSKVKGDAHHVNDIKCVTDDSFSSDVHSNKDTKDKKTDPLAIKTIGSSPDSKHDNANFETNRAGRNDRPFQKPAPFTIMGAI